MREAAKIIVPFQCPAGHQSSIALSAEDLRDVVATGTLTCSCQECGRSNAIHLTEAERVNIQRLIDHSKNEQLPEPTSPQSERH